MPTNSPTQVAEIQGLYGPVTVSEKLVQRLWGRGDYQSDALVCESGKSLTMIHPGRWNLHEGPDFIGAECIIGGERVIGDVEVHFYARDWFGHRHHEQPHFDRVVLHVVVFPGEAREPVHTFSGRKLETLVLLPHLSVDLETYVTEETLRVWKSRDATPLLESLLDVPAEARAERLLENARKRFSQKVAFARKRIENLGWERACHQLILEILGYGRNRVPMSAIAEAYSPDAWLNFSPEALFLSQQGCWKLAGLRPANHPRKRLEQYTQLFYRSPEWIARLQAWGASQQLGKGAFSMDTRAYRRAQGLTAQRREIANAVLAGVFSGTRLNTLIIDGLLPLLASVIPAAWFPLWFHWFPGDMPDVVPTLLQQCGLPLQGQPRSNGWYQGAWELFLESGL